MGAILDAATLRDAMSRFAEALRAHREEIDSLNVFPVPDGDTGTNMLLTQQAVEEALRELEGVDLAATGEAIGRAALMAARGNSGVILSQVLRGFCARLHEGGAGGAEDVAASLAFASEEADKAVARPVSGTMLSVLRDAADAARRIAVSVDGAPAVAEAALEAATESLQRTPEQLPALKDAGVVDAGGKGLVLFLDALAASLSQRPLSIEVGPPGPVGHERGDAAALQSVDYEFEVQYLLESSEAEINGLRNRLDELGGSLVVVGGGGLYNIHVHTNDPDAAVEAGAEIGTTEGVSVVSLADQVAATCPAGEARGVQAGVVSPEPSEAATERRPVGILAIVPGEGNAELFRSLGAAVLPGGPGNNPSVAELVAAIEAVPADDIIVLPNHKNVLPAAKQAAGLTGGGQRAHVLPTRSVHEGIAAATAFNPVADVSENLRRAEETARRVVAAEVATAVRDADTPAGPVRAGQVLGLSDGLVLFVGDDARELAVELVRTLVEADHEVLTLLSGADVTEEEASTCARVLRQAFPTLEVEVHHGGQVGYPYLIGLE
ncbi:MAG: DAK2 domain-containing protein [Actinomycetota bacterium]